MYRCQVCGQVTPSGTRANKIVVATRPKTYPSRGGERSGFRRRFRSAPSKPYDKGGEGREIVQELVVCESCAQSRGAEAAVSRATQFESDSAEAE